MVIDVTRINVARLTRRYSDALEILGIMDAVGFSVDVNDVGRLREHIDFLFESAKDLIAERDAPEANFSEKS